MNWKVYLAGEIHSDWRAELCNAAASAELPIEFLGPITDHAASDDCGVNTLGEEPNPFWHDRKGAGVNALRTRVLLQGADIVVVKFGDKYRQWNAAFDAGYASALNKSLIIMHNDEHQHALKEVDAAALAVTKNVDEIVNILQYSVEGSLEF